MRLIQFDLALKKSLPIDLELKATIMSGLMSVSNLFLKSSSRDERLT